MKDRNRLFITLSLFFIFIFTRIYVRLSNNFWSDESAELNSLTNIRQLLTFYLPGITAGYPGHYLLMFPVFKLFGNNRILLSLPGLMSQAVVFCLIPKIIFKLKVITKEQIFFASTVTRILFLLDPKITFQAIEIRPYSVMPFIWVIILFLTSQIIYFDRLEFSGKNMIKTVEIFFILLLLFYFHSVSAIMAISIYGFFMFRIKIYKLKDIIFRRSFIILFLCFILSLPVWKYFSAASCTFCYVNHFNTFKTAQVTLMELYAINKGSFNDIKIQNVLYFIALCLMLIILIGEIIVLIKSLIQHNYLIILKPFYVLNITLVLIPLLAIFVGDYMNRYGFWLRQLAWVMLPFYISIGAVLSGLNYKVIYNLFNDKKLNNRT